MTRTVSVRVIGFGDGERHSLNTLLRLSEQRDIRYQLWQAGPGPDLALIDSQSYEAVLEMESPSNAGLKMIWIGAGTPPQARRCFQRPVQWADVIAAMDELFQPQAGPDFDLSMPAPLDSGYPMRRALIASADRDHRLYLRARLALAQLTHADEAETGPDALELARHHRYDLALVDLSLPGCDGWKLVRQLRAGRPRIHHLIATNGKASAGERVRAWLAGAHNLPAGSIDPSHLQALLARV
ncbi:MAG: response regulator [Ramlibacter sp.]